MGETQGKLELQQTSSTATLRKNEAISLSTIFTELQEKVKNPRLVGDKISPLSLIQGNLGTMRRHHTLEYRQLMLRLAATTSPP